MHYICNILQLKSEPVFNLPNSISIVWKPSFASIAAERWYLCQAGLEQQPGQGLASGQGPVSGPGLAPGQGLGIEAPSMRRRTLIAYDTGLNPRPIEVGCTSP